LSAAELRQLADHARDTLVALLRGRTPSYYVYGVSDGSVSGLSLTVGVDDPAGPRHFVQRALRPGVPLQATLFRLCESVAEALRAESVAWRSLRVGLTVLSDPALHGTVRAPDLRGLAPAR